VALTPKQIQGILKTHRTKSRIERRDWDRWRAWYAAEYWGQRDERPSGSTEILEEEDVTFQTNYPYAYIDTMIANICPQNPQVTVLARQKKLQPAAQFREALVNDCFRRNKLHHVMWKTATNASICGRGLQKVVWNFEREMVQIFDVDPRYIFFDMSAAKFEDIRYLVEVTVLTKTEFNKRAKAEDGQPAQYDPAVAKKANFGGYPTWLKDYARDNALVNEASLEVYKWVTVYEVYDFESDKYFHILEGVEDPLFEGELPYRHVRNPFTLITFNENMTDLGGLSDVKLISSLQERLNEIDTLELWHAHTSTPVAMVNTALVDNPEDLVSALREANQPGSMIAVEGKANAPLKDIIGQTPTPSFSPEFREMRERCNLVIEFILGIPQYSRGVVGVADVATEVALADTATRTRNGRRIKMVEDNEAELAKKVIELYEEYLPPDTTLPIRLTDSQEVLEATRESLAMRSARKPTEPLEFDYLAIPYSPTENHRMVQLQKLQQYMPLLVGNPAVDQSKLITKLLDLLGMRDIVAPPQPAQPPGMPGAPAPGGAPPGLPPELAGLMGGGMPPAAPGAPGADTTVTGALPEGTEPPPVPTPMGSL